MILELVEFNSPKGWSRQQVAEEARNVIPKWQANKELCASISCSSSTARPAPASISGRRWKPRNAAMTRPGGNR